MATDAKADYLVTGNPDLLELKSIGKTKILNMREFTTIEFPADFTDYR